MIIDQFATNIRRKMRQFLISKLILLSYYSKTKYPLHENQIQKFIYDSLNKLYSGDGFSSSF